MRVAHIQNTLKAIRFDPDASDWPKGVCRVEISNKTDWNKKSWFELRTDEGIHQVIEPGDYVVTGQQLGVERRSVLSAERMKKNYVEVTEAG